MIRRRIGLALAALFFVHLRAVADDLPSWVFNAPKETADARFYVGSASRAASHAEAIEAAAKSAMQKAVTENFGVEAQFANQSYESTTSSTVTTTISEKSKRVQLLGFETRDSFVQKTANGWSAYILYSYKKSEILVERKRLSSVEPEHDIKFSEIGNGSGLVGGKVEITSAPEGATVTIDGKDALSKTPIRLTGVLEVGSHAVVIDHPDFETVTREVIVQPGVKIQVNVMLVPAKGYLSVSTTPSDATVIVDGAVVGTSPIRQIQVPANRRIKIDFIHPDAERSSIETTVARNESRNIEENLRLKPAHVQVTVTPRNAEVFIDGQHVGAGWQTLSPGQHSIKVSASNYQDQTQDIDLRGGEKRIEPIKLTPLTEIEHKEIEAENRLKFSPWTVGASLEYSGASFRGDPNPYFARVAFHGGRRFYGLLGIDLSLGIDASQSSNSTNTGSSASTQYNMTGYSAQIGMPVFVWSSAYIKPTFGYDSHAYTIGSSSTSFSISQTNAGVGVGYEWSWGRMLIPFDVGAVRYGGGDGYQGMTSFLLSVGILYGF